jgi:hypothetical protein
MNNHATKRRLDRAQNALSPAADRTAISTVAQLVNIGSLEEAAAGARALGAASVVFAPLAGAVQRDEWPPPGNRVLAVLAFEGGAAPTPDQLERVAALDEPAFAAAEHGQGAGILVGGRLTQFVRLSRAAMEGLLA